jgi:hypothetical protein
MLSGAVVAAENLDSFQKKAVKELYNKGILKNVVSEENFGNKENFNRYEVATILYNTLKIENNNFKNVSEKEILILKSLVSELAFELGRLGADNNDLMKEIEKMEERTNSKFLKEIERLENKVDRIRLTSDFVGIKEFRSGKEESDAEDRYKDMSFEGTATAFVKFSDFADGRVRYDFDNEKIDEGEINFTNDKFDIKVFSSDIEESEKIDGRSYIKLPAFRSTLGIINGEVLESNDGMVFNAKKDFGNFQAVYSTTDTLDIAGFEYVSKLGYFSKNEGQNSNYYISFINIDDKGDLDSEKEKNRILAIGGDFSFKMNENATQTFEIEYSKLRGRDSKSGTEKYKFPIVKDEANYFYSKTDVLSEKYGKIIFSTGGINTGQYYDLSKAGNDQKNPFKETDLIKMEQNKFGWMFNFDQKTRKWENNFQYVTYGSNTSSDISAELFSAEFMHLTSDKINMGFEFEQEKPEITLIGYNQDNGTNLTKLNDIKGDQSISYKLKLNNLIKKDSDNEIKISLIDKKDINENGWSIYADHTQLLGDFKAVKVVGIYEENYDYDFQNTSDYDKYDSIKLGLNYERDFWQKEESKVETKLILGGRFYKKEYEDNNLEIQKYYKTFGFFETEYENMTFRYGVNYSKAENINSYYYKDNNNEDDEITYGISAEYMYSKDFKVILSYGPVDYFNSKKNVYFEEEEEDYPYNKKQEQASLRIEGKF